MRFPPRLLSCFALIVAFLPLGCEPPYKGVTKVTGTVTIDDAPLAAE